MQVYGYVYLVINQSNGKLYIGQTSQSIVKRWKQHKYNARLNRPDHKNISLFSAIRQYGADSFAVVELHRAFSKTEIDDMETRAIWSHDSTNPEIGYNQSFGGEGGKWTEERKQARRGFVSPKRHTGVKATLPSTGETLPITQWATRLGITPRTLRSRLRTGWDIEEALTAVSTYVHRTPAQLARLQVANRKQAQRPESKAKQRANKIGVPLKQAVGVSGYIGVYAKRDSWQARFRSPEGKNINRTFATPSEAAQWRDEQSLLHYGDKAILNFPLSAAA